MPRVRFAYPGYAGSSVLTGTSTPEHICLNHWRDESSALTQLARRCVLLMPEMEGVVDDLEARVVASLEHFAMGGELVRGAANEKLLQSLGSNAGPVTIHQANSEPHVAGRFFSFIGEYIDASSESGIVHINIVFQRKTDAIYNLFSAGVLFRPGEDYHKIYDDLHYSDSSFVGE